jgi:hypothetical protein
MSQDQPDPRLPSPAATAPPKVLSNVLQDEHTVRVLYSLPGLRRANVHVPHERWQAGGHAPVGRALADMLRELDLQQASITSRLPES